MAMSDASRRAESAAPGERPLADAAEERRTRRTQDARGVTRDFGRMKRALRKVERRGGDGAELGGTDATILKFLPAPLARLADKKRIGTEEIRAADDIAIAFHAQAGALMIKPPSLEKRDATYSGREPVWIIDAVARYKRWARHWSAPRA